MIDGRNIHLDAGRAPGKRTLLNKEPGRFRQQWSGPHPPTHSLTPTGRSTWEERRGGQRGPTTGTELRNSGRLPWQGEATGCFGRTGV